MLTKLIVRNFKRFEETEIELGNPVVFVGPNNSGKTSALQALALWDIGIKRWNEKRAGVKSPLKRSGVAINRQALIAVPVPDANLLWRNLHVRSQQKIDGKQQTQNVRIDITVQGITDGESWECGLEFDYANDQSFYCKPLRLTDKKNPERMPIPRHAGDVRIGFLPPMSGLAANETRLDKGAVNVRIGEGRTAEVLRNLCYRVYEGSPERWEDLKSKILSLFGSELLSPAYVPERGDIIMSYKEGSVTLDISSSGRGLQQTLLLLAYMYATPKAVLLLDEPDAHLEILRQRQIYKLITDIAREENSQIIAASHSEVILDEAAGSGKVVAFIGKPHTITDRSSQLLKSLISIGWDEYYLSEEVGWVLYLEGPTDLRILQSFARTLEHPAENLLEKPFVHYVANSPPKARDHYYGLREAKSDLAGIAIFDHLEQQLDENGILVELMWNQRELENYLCQEDVLFSYARGDQPDDLFASAEAVRREKAMRESIDEITKFLEIDERDPWSSTVKATDEVLDRVFRLFFKKLKLPITLRKADYHKLASLVAKDKIDNEIREKLDAIVEVAEKANPRE